MRLVQKSASDSAVALSNVKTFLRVLSNDDDALITSLVEAATLYAQRYTNTQIMSAPFELYTSSLTNGFKMPKNPIKSITSIEVMGEDGIYVPFTDFYTYMQNGVTLLHVDNLPTLKEHEEAVKITFTCGYDECPLDIVSWINVKVASLYEFREMYSNGVISEMPKSFVDCMLDQHRVREF